VLQRNRGLSAESLTALAELEQRVLAVDGGRLKLEWGVLRSRSGERAEDLLWWQDGRLLGFVGMYQFGSSPLEFTGMVDPSARRRGIATALLDSAAELGVQRGLREGLLVVPGPSVAGRGLAVHRGGVHEHSEHALVLLEAPSPAPEDPRIAVRRAGPADAVVVGRLLQAAFGDPARDLTDQLAAEQERTLLVAVDSEAVGTVRLTLEGDEGGVYGFAVDPAWQGKGIGRDVLRRVCTQLREEGATRVGLEVAVDNDRALGLYTSLGFTPVTTEDYYMLPLTRPRG
jgi:ribosomal protein S18 acetylase RimI-like enzyme